MQNVHLLPAITRQTNSVYAYYLQLQDKQSSVYAYYLQLQDKQTACTLITYNYKTNKQCVRLLPTMCTLQDKQTVCTPITYSYKTNKQCVRLLPTITRQTNSLCTLLPTITRQTNSVYAYYLQLQDKQTVCTPITYSYKTGQAVS